MIFVLFHYFYIILMVLKDISPGCGLQASLILFLIIYYDKSVCKHKNWKSAKFIRLVYHRRASHLLQILDGFCNQSESTAQPCHVRIIFVVTAFYGIITVSSGCIHWSWTQCFMLHCATVVEIYQLLLTGVVLTPRLLKFAGSLPRYTSFCLSGNSFGLKNKMASQRTPHR